MSMAFHIGILLALSVMALVLLVNIASLRSLGTSPRPRMLPMVSALVPARNEERNIGQCIESMVRQDYPVYEILVLDDGSEDGTAAIVQEWERKDPRVRYIKGQPLPPGWVGKSFACHQLSVEAKGDILLFVDADTRHSPKSIISGVAALEHHRADLLTVLPHEIMETFWEKMILPLLHFNLLCFLPMPLVSGSRDPRFAMANGQYMMFRKSAYASVGGHAAVKDAMVEDVWLSRIIKRAGFKLRILDGSKVVSCRMYSSFTGIWHGFSKNLFAGFNFSLPALTAVILFHGATSILPLVSLVGILVGEMPASIWPIVAAQIGVLVAIRLLLSARFQLDYASAFLHPLAMSVVIGMAINSVRWVLVAGGSKWKGRAYEFKNQALAGMKGER
jgi:chlorobactene glucosyltransferase